MFVRLSFDGSAACLAQSSAQNGANPVRFRALGLVANAVRTPLPANNLFEGKKSGGNPTGFGFRVSLANAQLLFPRWGRGAARSPVDMPILGAPSKQHSENHGHMFFVFCFAQFSICQSHISSNLLE